MLNKVLNTPKYVQSKKHAELMSIKGEAQV